MTEVNNTLQSFAKTLHKSLTARLPGRGIALSDVQESLAQAAGAGHWNVAVAQQARLLEPVSLPPHREAHVELRFGQDLVQRLDGRVQMSEATLEVDPGVVHENVTRAVFTVEGAVVSVEMNGTAWRNLVHNDCVGEFLRLVALNQDGLSYEAARLLGSEEGLRKLYCGLVTRSGATESCVVYSTRDDADDILDEADNRHDWELNEGNPAEYPYFGGRAEEDVWEVSIAEYLETLRKKAAVARDRQRKQAALQLVKQLAAGDLRDAAVLPSTLRRAAEIVRD